MDIQLSLSLTLRGDTDHLSLPFLVSLVSVEWGEVRDSEIGMARLKVMGGMDGMSFRPFLLILILITIRLS